MPGGTLEFGEDLENALDREILEETNLEISNISFFAHQKIILDDVHWLGIYFVCDVKNWEKMKNREPQKHEKLQLFSWENLPKMHDEKILEKFFTK
ncbi:NUDIX domain-containing protein [Candidatus Gracilibacteria bacterium]|nr:NUDIX domain-containing protein [Candidatus Gracilibacteria bacterium]